MKNQVVARWLLGCGVLAAAACSLAAEMRPADGSYTPLAPPESYQAALHANLKIVRDWIDMGDFASANRPWCRLVTLLGAQL